ncbi:MAG TPA: formimidoylglutamate deiminase [Steroidobacteraceae bacterium]|nr:formimidoylglutamate deiminase [Steroidobacteraceae bacterium]
MYTQPSRSSSLWFATALLPEGWADRVRITLTNGRIERVESDVDALAADEKHAIGIPGVGNVHSHAFQRALAGVTERREGADNFWSWRERMYSLVAKLTPERLEAIAAQAFVEMLESGITCVAEFHYVHHAENGEPYEDIAEHAHRIVGAADTSGIGLTLLPVFYAHGGIGGQEPNASQRRFANSIDSYIQLFEASSQSVRTLPFANTGIAAHSLRAVTPEELETLTRIEHGGPMHIHIAEQIREVEQWQQWAGARPVEWLLDHVDVNERWCLVHATHVSSVEVQRMAASGATVGLCPITEANLGDGIFPASEFVKHEGRFGIGTDSNVSISIAEELRLLEYGQRLTQRERNVIHSSWGRSTGRTLLEGALTGGAQATMRNTGRLASGCVGDIVALRNTHVSMRDRSEDALLDSWIFAAANTVDCVWSGGRKVVAEGIHVERERVAQNYLVALRELRS